MTAPPSLTAASTPRPASTPTRSTRPEPDPSPRHGVRRTRVVRLAVFRLVAGTGGVLFAPLAALLSAVVAATRRPALLVVLTVALVALPYTGDVSSPATVTAADASSALLVAIVGLRIFGCRRVLPVTAWLLLSAVLLALGIATVNAQYLSASLQGFLRFAQLFVLVPAAVAIAMREARDRRLILGSVVALALVEGSLGVWQSATGTGASYGGEYIRAVGTFGALDIMGMSIVVGIGLLVALGYALALRGKGRAAAWSVVFLLVPPLILSLSRGTWIAVVCGATAMLLLTGARTVLRTVVFGTALAVVLVGGLGLGAGVIGDRLGSITSSTSTPDPSVSDRYDLWNTAFLIWQDHPVTGVGPKNFPRFRDSYAPLGLSSGSDVDDPSLGFQREPLLSPHNMYLLVLSEQGLLGALAFTGLLGALALRAVGRTRRARSPSRRALGLAASGLIVFHLVNYAYGDAAGTEAVFGSVILGIVMWWSLGTGPDGTSATAIQTARPPGPAGKRPGKQPGKQPGKRSLGRAERRALRQAEQRALRQAEQRHRRAAKERRRRRRQADVSRFRPRLRPRLPSRPPGDLIFKAAFLTAALVFAGSLLGLVRDLLLAVFFGATGDTDAFLVAWTVPETAAPLLIEEAMAFLMVPVFSRALAEHRSGREVVAATLPRIAVPLGVLTVLVAVGAPVLVTALAPDLADPALATTSMRLIAITVLMYGLTGYMAAALRSHQVYLPPATIYVAFNLGVLATMLLLHRRLGVLSVALGVSVGATLMMLAQLPSFLRHVGMPRRFSWAGWMGIGLIAPIGTYMIMRQAQVFIERFLGSSLEPGTISHLNYAQKVAQVPMTLAVTVATVTFPILARQLAGRRTAAARRRVEIDLAVIGGLVLLASAYILAFAPQIIQVLFQHGDFTAADTAATTEIIRIYTLGLLGQGLIGVLVRTYFSGGRVTWYPAFAVTVGLLSTAVFSASTVHLWGAPALAGGNAVGITVSAVLMLAGVRGSRSPLRAQAGQAGDPKAGDLEAGDLKAGDLEAGDLEVTDPTGADPTGADPLERTGGPPISLGRVFFGLGRSAVAAALAGFAAWFADQAIAPSAAIISALLGGVVVVAVFLVVAGLLGSPEIRRTGAALRRSVR